MDIKKEIDVLNRQIGGRTANKSDNRFLICKISDILKALNYRDESRFREIVDKLLESNQKHESLENSIKDLRFNHVENVNRIRDLQKIFANRSKVQPELKPCPFCGNVGIHKSEDGHGFIYYRCRKCSARSGSNKIEAYALDNWNKRLI